MRQRTGARKRAGRSRPQVAVGHTSVTMNSANPPLLVYWAFTGAGAGRQGSVMQVLRLELEFSHDRHRTARPGKPWMRSRPSRSSMRHFD